MTCDGQDLGHLIWKDGAMEAWTSDGDLLGRFPTRREAAYVLWRTMTVRKGLRQPWRERP